MHFGVSECIFHGFSWFFILHFVLCRSLNATFQYLLQNYSEGVFCQNYSAINTSGTLHDKLMGPGGQPTLKVAGWAGKRSPGNRASIRGAGLGRVVTDRTKEPDLPCTGRLTLGSFMLVASESDSGLLKPQAAPSLAWRRLYPG